MLTFQVSCFWRGQGMRKKYRRISLLLISTLSHLPLVKAGVLHLPGEVQRRNCVVRLGLPQAHSLWCSLFSVCTWYRFHIQALPGRGGF